MRIFPATIVVCVLFAAGCTPIKTDNKKAQLADVASRAITCKVGTDCDEKWLRAEEWIETHSAYDITAKSDSLIETAGPSGFDDSLGFTVTKKLIVKPPAPPLDPTLPPPPKLPDIPVVDKYAIVLFTHCNDWFGCTPSQLQAKADFANFVIGTPPPAKPTLAAKLTPLSFEMAQKIKLTGAQGLVVVEVPPASFAGMSGLFEGDIIVAYNGTPIVTEAELNDLMANTEGQSANLDIIRGRIKQTIVLHFAPAGAK